MLDPERAAVVEHLPALSALTPGRSGNLSARRGGRFAVTPTGVPYDEVEPGDVPVLALSGERIAGDATPSSETAMHRGIYRELAPELDAEVGAVAHAHAPWATTLAVLGEPLPPVHYALARAGGAVPVADYATYGTEALAANVVAAMSEAGTTACLLANHGLVAAGADAGEALATARAVESTARLYCRARTIGDPLALGDGEIDTVARKLRAYGQDEA